MISGADLMVERVRDSWRSAVVRRCAESGCSLGLGGLPKHTVLRGEKLVRNTRICDGLVFVGGSTLLVALVELRSRTVDVSAVKDKLENGTRMVTSWMKRLDCRGYELYHIVLAKKWRTPDYEALRTRPIKYQGRRYYIIPAKCGVSLAELLRRWGDWQG